MNKWGIGPALAVYRYSRALSETQKLQELPHQLMMRHLSKCRAYPDRAALVSSFPKGGTIAEVGVARGDFSQQLLEIAQPEKLILIDYWKKNKRGHGFAAGVASKGGATRHSDYDQIKARFAEQIAEGRVDTMRDWSWKALAQLDDASLDWIYIDASHDYNSVIKDFEATLPKIKPGGIVAGHDYVRWGRFGFRCGVIEAVAKFCTDQEFEMIGLTFERQYPPSYALRKIA